MCNTHVRLVRSVCFVSPHRPIIAFAPQNNLIRFIDVDQSKYSLFAFKCALDFTSSVHFAQSSHLLCEIICVQINKYNKKSCYPCKNRSHQLNSGFISWENFIPMYLVYIYFITCVVFVKTFLLQELVSVDLKTLRQRILRVVYSKALDVV